MSGFTPGEPAYELLALQEPVRRAPPEREQGLWGELAVELTVTHPVHVGAGVPKVLPAAGAPLAADVVRDPDGTPAVPGSSLKGALRVIVEALSPSCDPLDSQRRCKAKKRQVCPACAVFGLAGRRGLVAPSTLRPAAAAMEVGLAQVPQRYSHPRAPRQGRRVYRLTPEATPAAAQEVLVVLKAGTVLAGRIGLLGAPEWGAGLVAMALGVGPRGLGLLRIGGGKNRGLGTVEARLPGGAVAHGLAAWTAGTTTRVDDSLLERWQDMAVDQYPTVAQRAARIDEVYRR